MFERWLEAVPDAKGLDGSCLRAVGCVKRGCGRVGVKGREETFCPGKGVDVTMDEPLGNSWGVMNPWD